ncbi:MAG: prepilin-type N-terminal cleavage/methylation domain-containing protein [Phycisphaeraceae bacterium]|nr:prepilin-type N-terminal cleavage/methylation domain-containing protein [Phycisphaeraceae bacterium]
MRIDRKTVPAPAHRGFTLVEILVVVAIIAVLLSLGVGAGMKMAASNRLRSTKLLLSKLQAINTQYELLTKQKVNHSAVIKRPFLWDGPEADVVKAFGTYWSLFADDPGNPPAKVKLDKEYGLDGTLTGNPRSAESGSSQPWEDTQALHNTPTLDGNDRANLARHASIERWVWAMLQVPQTRQMIQTLSTEELKDTDSDGFLEVVDAWGRPLAYAAYVLHGPAGNDIIEMDQFLRQAGGPFRDAQEAVTATAKWRPFFASAGPDGYWGSVYKNYTPTVQVDANDNGVADTAEDNLYSYDTEGESQ